MNHVKDAAHGLAGLLGTSVTVSGILGLVQTTVAIVAGVATIIYMYFLTKKILLDIKEKKKKGDKSNE